MIIGVSGKIGSGKDTVGSIIQYLCDKNESCYNYATTSKKEFNVLDDYNGYLERQLLSNWRIIKFADKLKDIVCILLGCTREQLEDREFKNTELGEEWTRYGYADGFIKKYIGNGEMSGAIMNNKQCSKEEYEEHYKTNWQTAYKTEYTPRLLLQYIGTDLFREKIHENVWINATLNNYDYIQRWIDAGSEAVLPNYIITDVRFPNEADAIKQRKGINIRIEKESDKDLENEHLSETALDDYSFDYVVQHGTIENLIEQVKQILIKENII